MKAAKRLKNITIMIMFFAICAATFLTAPTSHAIVKEPRLNVKTLSLAKKNKYIIRVYNASDYSVSFASSDTNIINVKDVTASSCKLVPKSAGSAYVVATLTSLEGDEVRELKCKVKVSPIAISIKLSKKKMKLMVGDSVKIKYSIKPNISAEKPRFVSEHPNVASVSSTGVVTALAPGKVNIRAYIANGRYASCKFIISIKSDSAKPAKTSAPASASPSPSEAPQESKSSETPAAAPSSLSKFVATCDEY